MPRRLAPALRSTLIGLGFTALVVLALLWLSGALTGKIDGHTRSLGTAARPVPPDARLVQASLRTVPTVESAVGSIRAVRESAVASKILARVIEVRVRAGQRVAAGEVLIRLDDEELKARLEQAEAAALAAEAARNQARIEFERVQRLMEQDSASQTEFDRAQNALKSAEAELERARQARREAQTVLQYATVTSPMDGVVIDKRVEAGDTVTPGQTLLTLYDPTQMQLVASVRESLATRLNVQQSIPVRVDAIDLSCEGRISEIVPEAQPASRSFLVKVTGPCPPGVYAGMFGRLLIPLGEQEVLVVPRAAIQRVGQLDLVDVADGDRLRRRVVRLGRDFGQEVEVLAGLRAGEPVLLREPPGSAEGG